MCFFDDGVVFVLYYLVMNIYLFVLVVLLLVMVYFVWNYVWDDGMDDVDEFMFDCFDGDGDGCDFVYDFDGSLISEFGLYFFDGGEFV